MSKNGEKLKMVGLMNGRTLRIKLSCVPYNAICRIQTLSKGVEHPKIGIIAKFGYD